MFFDVFLLTPVSVFLLWLFWYSAPVGRGRLQALIDLTIAVVAILGAITVLLGLHATLDIEGIDRSLLAVAGAYVFLVCMLGLGWIRRFLRGKSSANP